MAQKVDKKRLFFFLNYRFFIYLLRSKHLQDRKRSLKVPKIILNPQMKRRFVQFCASWYVLSTRSEVLSKFGAFYTTFCRTHDTLIHFWKIGIVCALELVKIVKNVFFFSNTLPASLDHVEIVQLTSIKNYNLHFKSCT